MRKLIFAAVVILIGTVIWYRLALRPVNTADQAGITLNVPSGSSVRAIGKLLKDQKLIRSPRAFSLYARLHQVQGSMKAGGFFLRPSMSTPEIVNVLRRGFSEASVITIPEGFTVKDIDALLAEKGITKPGDVIACAQTCDFSAYEFLPKKGGLASRGGKLEGYLFPDTYFVVNDKLTPQSFLERLLSTFRKRVVDGLADDFKASKRSLADVVAMASLVEEETRTDEERPVVAGILWKRMDGGTGLYVDAAIRYAIDKPRDPLTNADLDTDSPYNLRKYRGLPPGPIANPGLESIKAALHPSDSLYLYYLHGKDGMVHYATTNDEHNENKRKYLR